jgi:HlyD family secretion protein
MNIVDLSDQWAVFNIREDELENISNGTEFDAVIPALGNKAVRYKVFYIKAMASYATYKPTKSNGGFDIKTFEVHARPVSKEETLLPGMSVLMEGTKDAK